MELEKLYKNAIEVSKNLPTLAAISGEKNKEELADLNVSQMNEGLNSAGKKIKPDYSPFTQKIKGFKTPNLLDEGSFHSGVYMERKGDRWLFNSSDTKTPKLDEKYSKTDSIFGIAPKNEQKAADEIEPDLFKEVENGLEKSIL